MEEKEDKGFVVRDRRMFSEQNLEEEKPVAEAAPEGLKEKEAQQAQQEFEDAAKKTKEESRMPLPEVTFATFVFSLSSSALVHLGEIPEPESQRTQVDLTLARQIIDTLGMLSDKTRGNLDPDEERLIKSILYDLRLRFVQKSGG
jgi:hypothetical protein